MPPEQLDVTELRNRFEQPTNDSERYFQDALTGLSGVARDGFLFRGTGTRDYFWEALTRSPSMTTLER